MKEIKAIIQESMLPKVVEALRGHPGFAGTINGDGVLEVKSAKLAGETTLAHFIRMVGEAQSRRAGDLDAGEHSVGAG